MNNNKHRKVALFVCHDLLGLLMLNSIIPAMQKAGMEPVIFNATTRRNKKLKVPSPSIVNAFNISVLEGVILPFLERRGDMNAPNLTYKQLAQKHGLQYREIEDVNDPAFLKTIRDDKEIAGGVSVRFRQIFDQPAIDAFREKGFLWNLHSGLLPDYKGVLLPYRAIENGEKEYGVTLHEVAPGIDGGAVVKMGKLPLDAARPVLDLYLDTVGLTAGAVEDAITDFSRGVASPAAPQKGAGKYYSNPTAEEFRSFAARGIFYVDPVSTLQRIADAFTRAGTSQNENLRREMKGFLECAMDGSNWNIARPAELLRA